MASKAIYARLRSEVYGRLVAYAENTGQSISSAVEDLIQKGIENSSLEAALGETQRELVRQKERCQVLEKEKLELQGSKDAVEAQLQACKTKEAIALSAQAQARELETQIANLSKQFELVRSYLLTSVGMCGKCHAKLTLLDVGQMKCRSCGKWAFRWLPGREPPQTGWEMARDGAAVVGAATIVIALLNALGSGGKDRGKT